MEDNLLNRATEISDNCVSTVQNRAVASFSLLPILRLIFWIWKKKGRDHATADKVLFSKKPCLSKCEVLLMTLKKSAFNFCMSACIY